MKYTPPDWVPKLEWSEFVKMRRKIRHPLTEFACQLIVGDLEKFRKQGYDPGAVLQESIKNGWRGVFIPNGGRSGRPRCSELTVGQGPVVPDGVRPNPAAVKRYQERLEKERQLDLARQKQLAGGAR